MKKFVAVILALIMMTFPTSVRAENLTIDDLIREINEIPAPEATSQDWDDVVERLKDHHEDRTSDEIKSIDQIAWLVQTMEKQREEAVEENHPLNILLGIGIWEEPKVLKTVEDAIHRIVEAFEAKTEVALKVVKDERTETGYCYFEVRLQEKVLGCPVRVKKFHTDGLYFESAWEAGSGRFGRIGNAYLSEDELVIPIKVAYLNEKNEVVEVVSEPGVSIESNRSRMILIQKGDTILGWISPYNIQ